MTDLVPIPAARIATTHLDHLEDEARGYLGASRSPATMRAYASDWRAFTAWCESHGLTALPAEPSTVVLYMTDLARTMTGSSHERPGSR